MKSRANPEKKILINVIFLFLKEQTWCVAGSTPNHRTEPTPARGPGYTVYRLNRAWSVA